MEKELMEKEVLCILDTRQIQRFIFHSNSYIDTLGGSDLIKHILDDAIRFALENIEPKIPSDQYDLSVDPDAERIPYFVNEKIQFQIIICAAGNAMFIARTGALCQKIVRKISRYYLEHGYSLGLAAAVAEKTDDLGNDIFRLYQKLTEVKASSDISDPVGALPVVIRENNTGYPGIRKDETTGEYYSLASALRRAEARKRSDIIGMKDIKPSNASNGSEYLAVIHADGNNLGITIGKLLQKSTGYEDGIRARRRINKTITATFRRAQEKTLNDLEEYYHSRFGDSAEFSCVFHPVHQAGDDINCICSADMVIPFLNALYENLKGAKLWESDDLNISLYVCAGVAFVTPKTDFHTAFRIAEECCKSAKTTAKKECNLRGGLAGNWIDYQICSTADMQELEMLREQSYMTKERINLMLRPYTLDPEDSDKTYSFEKLLQRSAAIKDSQLDEYQRKLLRQSYVMGRTEFGKWVRLLKRDGIDLNRLLGSPLYEDSDGNTHAVWFDAAELSDFV